VIDERARLFVALRLPVEVRQELVRWRASTVGAVVGLRLIAPEDLHVTLCFLGWRRVGEVDEIEAACDVIAAEPAASLKLGRALWLPSRRPRVLAVELEDLGEALGRLQSTLSRKLQAGGWYTPEARPFLAHVTVARVAKDARIRVRPLRPPDALEFAGSQITLFRSRLSPGGARYAALHTVTLGESAAPADPVSVVERFHAEQARVYAGGTADDLIDVLADDVVWHVPGRSRIAGEHRGRDAVLAYLGLRRQMTDATFRVSVHGLATIAGRVVQLAGGRAEREGRELAWETVGIFRVREGRIAECWLVPFDQHAFDEIWA
jgi:2'-5' RNA ligase